MNFGSSIIKHSVILAIILLVVASGVPTVAGLNGENFYQYDGSEEPNDNLEDAIPVDEGEYADLSIGSNADRDYYKVELTDEEEIMAQISFEDDRGDLDIQLLESSGDVVDESASTSDSETVSTTATEAGTYYILVYGYDGSTGSYSLNVETTANGTNSSRFLSSDGLATQAFIFAGVGILLAGTYVWQRRRSTNGVSSWEIAIYACLIGWIISIFGVNKLSDGIWFLIFISSWISLPISIFQDSKNSELDGDWPQYTWAYVVGSTIWFVSVIVGGVYLWQRYRHTINADVIDITDTSDPDPQSQSTSGSANEDTPVVDALQSAERDFQDAIAYYALDEQTVANIRFRQARNEFEEAQQEMRESDSKRLALPIEVNYQQEATLSSMDLEDLAVVDDTVVETLKADDIQSIIDLEDSTGEIIPSVVTDLHQNNEISKEEATQLTPISWWYESDIHEFTSDEEIERRYKQADYGFDQCT